MDEVLTTSFQSIYELFLTRVTDDMYMEMTELDVLRDLQDLLIAAIHRFEFPRFNIFDYEEGYYDYLGEYCGVDSDYIEVPATGWVGGYFNAQLTLEEKNILAINMMIEWFERQLATTELTKEKYSGSDFKFTSQANHMAKLKVMVDERKQESLHLQRLYKRRVVNADGQIRSTMGQIMSAPSYGYVVGNIKYDY